jgi:hypothetical protein
MARSEQGGSTFSSVVYSMPSAAAVADFVSTHYDLPESIDCRLLYSGWNDIFDVRTKDGKRFVFRISKRRARGDADVASKTEFLAYLDGQGILVAAAVPMRAGSLFNIRSFPASVPPSCSITPKVVRHGQEVRLATQEQTGRPWRGCTMSLVVSSQAIRAATDSTASICCTDLYPIYRRLRISATPYAQGLLI